MRAREISPRELVEAAIARIERFDSVLNTFVVRLFEEARTGAEAPDLPAGPFRGVPFAYKDIGAALEGQPRYAGNRALRDARNVARRSDPMALRLRRAGLVPVGRTNLSEFGILASSQPRAFGATRNPWDLERSAGGSSGGSCAAVAAGLVPVAHASDGGGSIRMPAAWCGIVGLKPSRGRTTPPPPGTDRLGVEFAVARSVRDVAGLLDALHGNEPGDLYLAAPPVRPYLEDVAFAPPRLRIGMFVEKPGLAVDPECLRAVLDVAKLLESLGHRVEVESPAALLEEAPRRSRSLQVHGMHSIRRDLERTLGRPICEADVEPFFWSTVSRPIPPATAEEMAEAAAWQQGWCVRLAEWWASGFDLLLTPTVPEPPPLLADLEPPAEKPWLASARTLYDATFTLPFNAGGQPAISLPLDWTAGGLPIGVQLVAAVGREDLLIGIASELERARPWIDCLPPFGVSCPATQGPHAPASNPQRSDPTLEPGGCLWGQHAALGGLVEREVVRIEDVAPAAVGAQHAAERWARG